MNRTTHELKMAGSQIVQREVTSIVAGSVNADEVTLSVGSEWDGLTLSMTFVGSGESISESWDGESAVTVPWECVAEVGQLYVGLVGRDGADVRVSATMPLGISVVEASATVGESSVDPTVTEYQQALADVLAATDEANALIAQMDEFVTRDDLAEFLSEAEGAEIIDGILA